MRHMTQLASLHLTVASGSWGGRRERHGKKEWTVALVDDPTELGRLVPSVRRLKLTSRHR